MEQESLIPKASASSIFYSLASFALVVVIICSQIPSTRYLAKLLSEKGNIPDIDEE